MSGPRRFAHGTGDDWKSPDVLPPLLSALVDALPGPLLVVDADDCVVTASPTVEALFECERERLLGQPLATLFLEGSETSPALAVRKDGGVRRIEISRRQLQGLGVPLTLLWLADVTERDERRRAERRLRAILKDLERATKAKSEFLATMSHELRTPMSAVLGMTDILLDSALDEEQRELAERVRRAGVHLLTTINDVLDLSKVEAGRLDLESARIPLRGWLAEVIELFDAQAIAKKIALRAEVAPSVPEAIDGDSTRLRQILVNLIGNAVKFTDSGHVAVHVTIVRSSNARKIEFCVEDTGIGIPAEELDRLFEPWRQVSGTSMRHAGTGLGLAIARRLVECMGGTISAGSDPGRGSTFRFSLPLRAEAPVRRHEVARAPRKTELPPGNDVAMATGA